MKTISNFPYRQVHIDFHTAPQIPGIGSRFSKENFQAALKAANVDSVTVFAKCHHSMCYYPTDVGMRHPNLDFDLTGAMVDAAHEIGVRAPIYVTGGWSHLDALNHPEWRAVRKDGTYFCRTGYDFSADSETPKHFGGWLFLCLNDGAYAHHIYELTEEICKRYSKVDGLFYDICGVGDTCYCPDCLRGMKEMGLDPDNEADAKRYFILKRQAFMEKCNHILQAYHPGSTIFFNSGGANKNKPEYHDLQSHFEMEDLPTAWGGYDQLPLRARFFRNKQKPFLGMTGKFHLAWGEFGGFKTKEALKYEIASMALYGAGASIGDHMHPDGEMEIQTYENIGYAYNYLERIAPFCYGGKTTADLAIFLSPNDKANEGLSNILLQNQIDYNVISNNDFHNYAAVILPENVVLDEQALTALKYYLRNGGKLICMADALVKNGKYQLDIGLEYLSGAKYDCDYLIPMEPQSDLPDAPMLCNIPGHRVRAKNAEVFAEIITPYFSRTYGHFCGHRNTPHNKNSQRFPGIIKTGNVVYLAHSLARDYQQIGSVYHRNYFIHALSLVYTPKLQVSGLGSQGRCTMIQQSELHRYCINMTYASPIRRGQAEIIEDMLPIYNIDVRLDLEKEVTAVYMGLTEQSISFTQNDGNLHFTVPELQCHTSIVIEYK